MKYWATLLVLTAASALGAAVCEITTSGMAFGSYDAISEVHVDTLGTVTVTCTGNVGDSVNLQLSMSPGNGSYVSRQMIAGALAMLYNLFTDASRTVVWGDGAGGTGIVSDSFTLDSSTVIKNYTVYGRIYGGQNQLTAQSYSDTVAVTLSY
jgi:spore coat protein U-like protein